jgi:predicted O-methyltransferase YrrM
MTPIRDLPAHYQFLLTCSDSWRAGSDPSVRVVDTLAHLPLFHSLPGRVLEIGCDVGNSTTAFLAGASSQVTSIDINPQCAGNFPDCAKWRFVLGDSQQRSTFTQIAEQGGKFDVLFVDGDHSYEAAIHDICRYANLVRSGGLILLHDVLAHDNFPGVWQAFREFSNHRVRGKYVLPGSYGLGVIEL